MEDVVRQRIEEIIKGNKVVLFMKGTKDNPMCGFSNQVVQVLGELNIKFKDVNVLEDEAIREGIKEFSNWPTIPQLYIDGRFVGGCDITVELYREGELQKLIR